MFDDQKSWWMSKTILGGIAALMGGILGVFGYTFAPEDQALLVEIIGTGITVMGSAVAIWGRTKATKALGK